MHGLDDERERRVHLDLLSETHLAVPPGQERIF